MLDLTDCTEISSDEYYVHSFILAITPRTLNHPHTAFLMFLLVLILHVPYFIGISFSRHNKGNGGTLYGILLGYTAKLKTKDILVI